MLIVCFCVGRYRGSRNYRLIKRLFDTCAAELKTKSRNIRLVAADGNDRPILGVAELDFVVAGCDTIAEAFISENINETCILRIDLTHIQLHQKTTLY